MFTYNSMYNEITSMQTGKIVMKVSNPDSDYANSTLAGVGIVKKLRKTFPDLDRLNPAEQLEALYMIFTEQTRALGWTWNPGFGNPPYGLIDNQSTSAECKAFAGGMFYLAVAPPPFGLGLPVDKSGAAGVALRQYSEKNGFVSSHPRDGVLNLDPNVFTPEHTGAAEDIKNQTLYYWANHWVVVWRDKIYDPTYGCQYAQIEDMRLMSVEKCEALAGPKSFAELEMDDAYGAGVMTVKSRAGREYYIRLTPTSLRASEGHYQGPITRQQCNWLREQLSGRYLQSLRSAISASEVFAAGAS